MSDRFGNLDKPDIDVAGGNNFGLEGKLDLSTENYGQGPASDYLEHISKSRIKTYLKCNRKFAFKYLAEVRADENFYMTRGTRVHDAYEEFHLNLEAFISANSEPPDNFTELLPPASEWFQFIEFIGPFFEWELDRWEEAQSNTDSFSEALEAWRPHSVEESLTIEDPPVGEIPWLGPYDALLDVRSIPYFEQDSGYVVVDYKTGSLPKPQWRDKGIHIDLEFYSWMLEESGFDVAGAIGFYPTEEANVVRTMPNSDIRELIEEVVGDLHSVSIERSEFSTNPNPLCDYCYFYEQCPTTWSS